MNEFLRPQINRDERAEVIQRLMRVAENIGGFQGKTAEEVFNPNDEIARRELIKNISGEQYCQLVTGINGILRDKEKEDWEMDGVGVSLGDARYPGAHIFPNHKDKKEILIKSWEAAQKMNSEGRDMEDIGLLLGSMLGGSHPFNDGNGRTSRFVYSMMKDGYRPAEISEVLTLDGRFTFDMTLSRKYLNELFERKYGRLNESLNTINIDGIFAKEESVAYASLKFPEGVSKEVKDSIMQGGRNDSRIFIAGIFQFLKQHPEIEPEEYVAVYPEKKNFILQRLLSTLTKEQIEELSATYWDIKKKYSEDMIDVFANPDKPEYKVNVDGKEVRMIDYFKQRLAEGGALQ